VAPGELDKLLAASHAALRDVSHQFRNWPAGTGGSGTDAG
jgi:hypothetical protein